jgi:hypothetical protein
MPLSNLIRDTTLMPWDPDKFSPTYFGYNLISAIIFNSNSLPYTNNSLRKYLLDIQPFTGNILSPIDESFRRKRRGPDLTR